MISPWLVYLVVMLDNINILFRISIILSVVSLFIILVNYMSETTTDDEKLELNKKWKNSFMTLSVGVLLFLLVPSTKQAVAIYIIPKVSNSISTSKFMQSVPDKLETIINNLLKEDKDVHANK